LAVGRERLRGVSTQLADLMGASVSNTEKTLRAAAGDSAVARLLRSPTAGNRAAALAAIRKTGPGTTSRIAVEIWDSHRSFLLSSAARARAAHGDVHAELASA